MTAHDEQSDNEASKPVEPNVECISIGRGTYAASLGGPSKLEYFEKFLDPERKSFYIDLPDIDLNFNDRAHDLSWITDYLQQNQGHSVEHPAKLVFERFLDPARADLPQPGDWFTEEQYLAHKNLMDSAALLKDSNLPERPDIDSDSIEPTQ